MNILICSHAFAPSVGGVENYVMSLARGLAESRPSAGMEACNVAVLTPTPAGGFLDTELPFRVQRQSGLVTLWQEIAKADVVHLAGPMFLPMLLGFVRRRSVVIEHHGYTAICPNGLLLYQPTCAACPGHFMARRYQQCIRCNSHTLGFWKSLKNLLLTFPRRWLSQRATANLPISDHVRKRLQLPHSRVIYYGVPDSLSSSEQRGAYQDPTASRQPSVVFAYVGRLVAEKGLPILIQAAARLRASGHRFQVKFIGDGPERDSLQKLAANLHVADCLEFTGYVTGAAMDTAVADVGAVVMPSIWEETAGLSAMEQMMRARLVIASDIGGLGEVVGDAGMRFPAGDVEALTACMDRVIANPSLISEFGVNARSRALQKFGLRRMVDDHQALYSALLSQKPSPRTSRHW